MRSVFKIKSKNTRLSNFTLDFATPPGCKHTVNYAVSLSVSLLAFFEPAKPFKKQVWLVFFGFSGLGKPCAPACRHLPSDFIEPAKPLKTGFAGFSGFSGLGKPCAPGRDCSHMVCPNQKNKKNLQNQFFKWFLASNDVKRGQP